MNRRNFTKKIASGASLLCAPIPLFTVQSFHSMKPKRLKPKRLKPGQTVGLIAPGSSVDESRLQKAISTIKSLGLTPFHTDTILAKRGYLAGNDAERLADLHLMFKNPKVDAIWCIRGGYGCTRLLPAIDYKLIRKHPKILIGYSDITALLQAIYKKTGLIGFHGPVAVSEPTDYSLHYLRQVLLQPSPQLIIKNAQENISSEKENYSIKVIRSGRAKGRLAGGNLSLISAMAGTDYAISIKNKILFLEDIGEKPYRIDRMLTQLRQAYDLNKAAAIVLGIFADCEGGKGSLSLMETLQDRLGDLKIPVIYGMSFGHIDHQMTLPVGIKAELDTDKATITLLENAVEVQ